MTLDANLVNPFIASFNHVMKSLGFHEVRIGTMDVKGREIFGNGVILMVGLVGQLQGNIVYVIADENAKKIASTMMMGMPVNELDELARSSLSELSNMLSAHAATGIANHGYTVDISPPIMMNGTNVSIMMSSNKVLCVEVIVDNMPILLHIAIA